jgi:hypothetical protein
MLSDPKKDIRREAENTLGELLRQIKTAQKISVAGACSRDWTENCSLFF